LEGIIKSGSFTINTRIVKYILNYDHDSFRIFIGNQTSFFIDLLYDMALGNGYHHIDAYSKNLNFITLNLLNNHKIIQHGN
jgi:hypothetical protein